MTVETWPGPMKPSSRMSGESRMARIAGMMVTWLQKTEKFSIPSALARISVSAVDGAVVSKPIAKNIDVPVGIGPRQLERVRSASRRCARPARAPCARAGCRARRARASCRRTPRRSRPAAGPARARRRCGPSAARRPGSPGPWISSMFGGQDVLEAEAVDRVRVAAAHLHQPVVPRRDRPGGGSPRPVRPISSGSRNSSTNFMARPSPPGRSRGPPPWRPRPRRASRACASDRSASCSLILLMANPTWISTQSPTAGVSSCSRPRSTRRRTPVTSTIARSWAVRRPARRSFREWPGTWRRSPYSLFPYVLFARGEPSRQLAASIPGYAVDASTPPAPSRRSAVRPAAGCRSATGRATMSNVNFTSSFTLSMPPATVTGLMPYRSGGASPRPEPRSMSPVR